MNYTNC